jgi:hypothetical protein
MNLDTEFLQTYVAFLNTAFTAKLGAKETIERTDIMVYALAAKLCSLIGTRLDFLDFVSQGKPGGGGPHHEDCDDPGHPGGGPHTDQGGGGGSGPHYLQMLISYATGVSTPELADAFRKTQRAG